MNRRKELQQAYAMKQRSMGVFMIRHKDSGKMFIGSSSTLDSVWQKEKFVLNMGSHMNSALQKDWKDNGESAFEFGVLEKLQLGDEVRNDYKDVLQHESEGMRIVTVHAYRRQLRELEQKWLDEHRPYGERGYNKPPKTP